MRGSPLQIEKGFVGNKQINISPSLIPLIRLVITPTLSGYCEMGNEAKGQEAREVNAARTIPSLYAYNSTRPYASSTMY